ncbi:acyl-homoserine-lactone acylase [Nocardioides massiliensis]|uniref:Acyl-homoserine-lactone acylase n=1 Tax=Nocardioides massiliensis TaxID=1325935 RepID=A0ABT9NPR1_9ACTN|nr:acyl-homoserine-lactone acylase [Nocardioides massiliensis]
MRAFRRTAATLALAVALPVLPALASTSATGPASAADRAVGPDPVAESVATAAQRKGAPLRPRGGTYEARVTRTKHGIPHIVAKDWGSLGFGQGYATAEVAACNLLDTLITGRGERSRWFGPNGRYQDLVSVDASNLESDILFTDLRNRRVVEKLFKDSKRGPGPEARAIARGYLKGVNRYLRDVGGPNGITDPECRGKAYVRPGTVKDLWYGVYAANLLASGGVFVSAIASATPPTLTDPGLPDVAGLLWLPARELSRRLPFAKVPAEKDLPSAKELRARLGKDPDSGFGSNATAIGGAASANGRGMVLGNPHFPWSGRYRFSQAHLTIPGHYDIAGASLIGSPGINIGFNKDVAWSHTVSTAYRFTPYEYRTLPGLPTTYLTTSGPKQLQQRKVTVTLRRGGKLRKVTRTIYRTDEGYVIDAPDMLMGWTPISVFAIRDANGEHLKTVDSFLDMGKGTSSRDLLRRQDASAGVPWVNTIAADRAGNVIYADHSVVPNVPNGLVDQCITPIGLIVRAVAGLPILDGTRASGACAWRNDADAARPGIFGPKNLPDVTRRDWVANANDSYWTPNDKVRLEGFANIIGCEDCERTLRTQQVYRYVTDARKKGRITHRQLAGFQHQNKVRAAILSKRNGDLGKVCRAADGGSACKVLAKLGWARQSRRPGRAAVPRVLRAYAGRVALARRFRRGRPVQHPAGPAGDQRPGGRSDAGRAELPGIEEDLPEREAGLPAGRR